LVPMVVEQTSRASAPTTSTPSAATTSFSGTPIDDQVANLIVAQMLFLSARPEKDVHLHQLPGLDHRGLASTTPCSSSRTRWRRSASASGQHGAFLLLAGTKGKRFALPTRAFSSINRHGRLSGQRRISTFMRARFCASRDYQQPHRPAHRQPLDRIERDVERTSS